MTKIMPPSPLGTGFHTASPGRDPQQLGDQLVPIAARLVATVHDEGPDAVAAVLAEVPDGRHDALAVVLAAMVDPARTVSELLAWTHFDPTQRIEYDRLTRAGVSRHAADVLAEQAGLRRAA